MAEPKRLSGRAQGSAPKKKATAPAAQTTAPGEGEPLRSPWIPLVWILLPLIACVVYGVATRH